jgi:hypothetical protein
MAHVEQMGVSHEDMETNCTGNRGDCPFDHR